MNTRVVTAVWAVVPPQAPVKMMLSVAEAAQALSIGEMTAWKLIREGKLPSIKIGRSRRIKTADLERFVAELPEAS